MENCRYALKSSVLVECSPGAYGYNCSESCGHCLGTSTCDPVHGRCTNGCEPGWQPTDKCDTSEQLSIYFMYLKTIVLR